MAGAVRKSVGEFSVLGFCKPDTSSLIARLQGCGSAVLTHLFGSRAEMDECERSTVRAMTQSNSRSAGPDPIKSRSVRLLTRPVIAPSPSPIAAVNCGARPDRGPRDRRRMEAICRPWPAMIRPG